MHFNPLPFVVKQKVGPMVHIYNIFLKVNSHKAGMKP